MPGIGASKKYKVVYTDEPDDQQLEALISKSKAAGCDILEVRLDAKPRVALINVPDDVFTGLRSDPAVSEYVVADSLDE